MQKPGLGDTHLHLQAAPSPRAYLEQAGEQGVKRFYCMCAGFNDLKEILRLKAAAAEFQASSSSPLCRPEIKVFMGCHPAFLSEFNEKARREFEAFLRSPFISGIGEVGLDARCIDKTPLKDQQAFLRYFLDTACALDLPVSLHCVKAHNELLSLLKSYQGKLRCCVHGLNLSRELLAQYLRAGAWLSLGQLILKPDSRISRTLGRYDDVRSVLLTRILLESDFDGRELAADYYTQLKQRAAELLGFTSAAEDRQAAEALLEAQLFKNEQDYLNEQVLLCN